MDWDTVVSELGPRLWRYFRVCLAEAEAHDAVQETLLRLVELEFEKALDPSRGSVASFAFGVARRVRWEALRKQRRHQSLLGRWLRNSKDTAEAGPTAEQLLSVQSGAARLRAALPALSEAEGEVVNLLLDEELTLPEIGQILGMPVGTVKSHAGRARAKLKKCLSEDAPGEASALKLRLKGESE